jgi:K+-sensing histidine kinase KdpD
VPADIELAHEILREGRRLATRIGLGWVALLVQTRSLRPARRETVRNLSELVMALGGQMVCEEADDVALALIQLSQRERAPLLVIGPSKRPRFLRRLISGTTERVLRAKRPFDVIVATMD